MKRLLMFAPALLFSLMLHAAAVGIVMWTTAGAPTANSTNAEVWIADMQVVTSKPRPVERRPKPSQQTQTSKVDATLATPETPSSEAPSIESDLTEGAPSETASEIFDLTSVQTHPYFLKLSKILNEAKRGLLPHDGHPEQFAVQIGIAENGRILGVHIAGENSRLKDELTERMARLGFLPALPKDIFSDREKIEIRYRVLFQHN